MSRAGYVLTGGRSSRMGLDKALLPFRGGTLAGYVAGEVSRAAGSATLVGDPQTCESLGWPVIPDLYPGEGPLGGILTALAHTGAEWNLITACDMPAVSGEFLRQLLDAGEGTGADALVPVNAVSGLAEPLCAVYRRDARAAIEAAFARGVRKVMAALESCGAPESDGALGRGAPEGEVGRLRLIRFSTAEVACFQNVNTPEEWNCVDL